MNAAISQIALFIQQANQFKFMVDECKVIYIGETSKSSFTRGNQHQAKYNATSCDASTSWMKEHQLRCHNGAQEKFKMEVLQVIKDAMSRQIFEAVRIKHAVRNEYDVSNEKSEWHSASLVSVVSEVQTEIRRNPGG